MQEHVFGKSFHTRNIRSLYASNPSRIQDVTIQKGYITKYSQYEVS